MGWWRGLAAHAPEARSKQLRCLREQGSRPHPLIPSPEGEG